MTVAHHLDDDRLDRQIGLEADFLEGLQVGRIGQCDKQPVSPLVQRQDTPRLGDLDIEIRLVDLLEFEGVEIEKRNAEGARAEDRELLGGHPLASEDLLGEGHAGRLRL